MRSQSLSLLALCGAVSHAFQDTSPLFAFESTLVRRQHTQQAPVAQQYVRSNDASQLIRASLEDCSTDAYIFVSQPGVSVKDFSSRDAVPHMHGLMNAGEAANWRLSIPEVVGQVDLMELQNVVVEKCGAKAVNVDALNGLIGTSHAQPQYMTVDFPALPSSPKARAARLLEHDSFLNAVIDNLDTQTFTVVYTTSSLIKPAQKSSSEKGQSRESGHEMENPLPEAMHTDLKRDMASHIVARQNGTSSNAPLFETYSFLSPGVFMGLVVSLLLFLILYVGVSAISGLEISVAAFSKEMGPAAQKKQQ